MRIIKNLYGLPRFFWVVMLGIAFIVSGPPSELGAQALPSTPQQQTFSAPFLNQPGGAGGITSFQQNLSPDGIVNGIQTASNSWVGVLSAMATRLFFLLVIIDFAWMVLQWILQGRENTGEFLGQWVVKLVGVNVMYFLVLVHGWEFSQIIINSILTAGSGLVGLNGNEVRPQNFLGIAATGVGIATPMLVQAVIYALIPNVAIVGWTNLQLPLLWTELFGATAVIGAYVLMAGSILLVWVEMYIATAIGVLMLGFSGSRWTQGFGWEKYLSLTLSLGIKMLMTYVCVDLALSVGNSIIAPAMVPGIGAIYAGFIASIMSLIVYNIPAFASSLMQGASNSGAGQAMSFANSTAGALTSAMQSMVQSMERVADAMQNNNSSDTSKDTSTQQIGAVQYGHVPGQLVQETPQAIATELGLQEREMDYAAIGIASGSAGGAPTGLTDILANQFGPGGNGNDGMRGADGRDAMTPPPPAMTAFEQELQRDREPLPAGAGFVDLGNGQGAFVADNGMVMLPNGSLVSPAGLVRTEDGAFVRPDGTVQLADRTMVLPNGDAFDANGNPVQGGLSPSEAMSVESLRYEGAIARAEASAALDRMGTVGPVTDAEMGSGRAPLPTNAQVEMLDRLEQARQAEERAHVDERSSFGTVGQYAYELSAARDAAGLSSSSVAEPSAEFLARTAELQRENGMTFSAPGLDGALNGNSRPMEPVYATPSGNGASNNGMSMNEARVDSASLEAETRRIEDGLGSGTMSAPISNEFKTNGYEASMGPAFAASTGAADPIGSSSRPMDAMPAGTSGGAFANESRPEPSYISATDNNASLSGASGNGASSSGASSNGMSMNEARLDSASLEAETRRIEDGLASGTMSAPMSNEIKTNGYEASMGSAFAASTGAAEPIGNSSRPMDAMPAGTNGGAFVNDARPEPSYISATDNNASLSGASGNSASSNGMSMNEARVDSASLEAETRRIEDGLASGTMSSPMSNEIKTNGYEASAGQAFTASTGAAEPIGNTSRPMDTMSAGTIGGAFVNDFRPEPSYISATDNNASLSGASGNGASSNGASSNGMSMNEARVDSASLEAETRRMEDGLASGTMSAPMSNEIKTNGYEASIGSAFTPSTGAAEPIGNSSRPMDAMPAGMNGGSSSEGVSGSGMSRDGMSMNEARVDSASLEAETRRIEDGFGSGTMSPPTASEIKTNGYEASMGSAFTASTGGAFVNDARPEPSYVSATDNNASLSGASGNGASSSGASSNGMSMNEARVDSASLEAETRRIEDGLASGTMSAPMSNEIKTNGYEASVGQAFTASTGAAEPIGNTSRSIDAVPAGTNGGAFVNDSRPEPSYISATDSNASLSGASGNGASSNGASSNGASSNGMSMNEARPDSASLEAETRRTEDGLASGTMSSPMSNEIKTNDYEAPVGPSFTASTSAAEPVGISGRPMDGIPSATNGIGASNDASLEPSYVSATESSASGNGFSGNGAYSNGSSMTEARSDSASLEAETRRIVDSPRGNASSASSSNEIKTNGYEASTGLAFTASSVSGASPAPSGARPEPPSAAYAPNEPVLPGKNGTSFTPSEPAPTTAAPNQGEQRPDMVTAPPSAASIATEAGVRPAANTAGKSTDALLEPPSAAYTSGTSAMGGPGVSEAKFSGTDATSTNGSNRESFSDRDDAEAATLEEKKPSGIFGRLVDSVLGRQPEKETVRETVVREKGEMVGSAAPRGTNAPVPTGAPETDAQTPAPYDPNSAQAFAQPSSPMPSSSDPEQRKTIFDDDRLRKRDENEKRGES